LAPDQAISAGVSDEILWDNSGHVNLTLKFTDFAARLARGGALFQLTPLGRDRMLWDMQLTIEIPDDQASRMGMDREGMQQLIARIITQVPKLAVVDELIEFLGRGPQPDEIVAFQVSQNSQTRVRDLLDKSRAGTLSADEASELDTVESLNHLFALIKARAWQHLPSAS
jgi:hypothetical protein